MFDPSPHQTIDSTICSTSVMHKTLNCYADCGGIEVLACQFQAVKRSLLSRISGPTDSALSWLAVLSILPQERLLQITVRRLVRKSKSLV